MKTFKESDVKDIINIFVGSVKKHCNQKQIDKIMLDLLEHMSSPEFMKAVKDSAQCQEH